MTIEVFFLCKLKCVRDQDQDSLLVKRRNDNHSPGPVIRELVPSCHQRSELRNTILCIFSGWDQRIGEGIPIPDSLGEETTFINIYIGNGSLKCQRVLISTTPSFGDKVINITLTFHCVFFILNFAIANTVQQKVLFQTQYLMRCHLCTKRTTSDQERCPGGHPTKPEPSQILLHLQQLVVVWSKEKNLSISMSCHRFHS